MGQAGRVRRWVIDAFNVLGARPDGWWRDRAGALSALVDEITRWRAEHDEPVLVMVDGRPQPLGPPPGEWYGVEVRYAGHSDRNAADDAIVELLGAEGDGWSTDRDGIVVVTSDRDLASRVEAIGTSVEGAGAFRRRLEDIEARRDDRAVLAELGIDESALLGRGGEARVFALGRDRVVRLPHPGVPDASLDDRRTLLDAIASGDAPFAVPEVIEHRVVGGRTVVIERRLLGESGVRSLADRRTDRGALITAHLDAAAAVATLACPGDGFGERMGAADRSPSPSFASWTTGRLAASLAAAGPAFEAVDADRLTAELLDALPDPEPTSPVLVHLDAYLGNMLAERSRITAVVDFGPTTIAGPPDLDPLTAIAYLTPEITPGVTDDDRIVAVSWASARGLTDAVGPAERWAAAFWAWAADDERLHAWCRRVLETP